MSLGLDLSDAIDYYTNDNEVGTVVELDIESLVPFHDHPFELYTGQRLDDMVESIKNNGILTPVIVRKLRSNYEILVGHNRTNAAKIAGLKKIPCIIKNKLSDEDAYTYVIETNLMQRSFSELKTSQKALVLTVRYENMKSQGRRNDIIRELKILNGEILEAVTDESMPVNNRDNVAKEYGLSGPTVARLLRVNYLPKEFKDLVDEGNIPLLSAVNLSYIDKDILNIIYNISNEYRIKITEPLSKELRKSDAKTEKDIMRIMIKPKSTSSHPKVRVNTETYNRYLKDKKPDEIEEIISKALENYFNN